MMICPYCGRYNPDNSVYCEGCGRPLKKKSSNSFISNNKFLIIMGGIILLVILGVSAGPLLLSGVAQSYSDGKISFDYPSDFFNVTLPEIGDYGDYFEYLGDYNNSEGVEIIIAKTKFSWAATDLKVTNNDINNENETGKIISQTKETNPNNITIYKDIYTKKNKNESTTKKVIAFTFNDKNGLIYSMSIGGNESDFQKVSDTADMIFASLKFT